MIAIININVNITIIRIVNMITQNLINICGWMLSWQQHFEGYVLLKFEFLDYFVDLIGL